MADRYYREPGARHAFPLFGLSGKPLVTWTLLAVNILVWLAMENTSCPREMGQFFRGCSEDSGVLLDFGALFGPLIASGEYWRLFTAMFLHVGFIHLLFNGFGLLIFGSLVERIYGHTRFALIYLLAGLSGSVASYLFNSIAIGAGASGAIFGVLGALAAYFRARRDMLGELGRQNLSGILVIAAINLVFGFVTPGIDNWAHMGGFVAGFAVGLAFAPNYRPVPAPFEAPRLADTNSLARKWWVVPAGVAILFAGTWMGTATLPENAASHLFTAERFFEQQRYDEALVESSRSISLDPLLGEARYIRGRILADIGDLRGARFELSQAIQLSLDPKTRRDAISLLVALESRQ